MLLTKSELAIIQNPKPARARVTPEQRRGAKTRAGHVLSDDLKAAIRREVVDRGRRNFLTISQELRINYRTVLKYGSKWIEDPSWDPPKISRVEWDKHLWRISEQSLKTKEAAIKIKKFAVEHNLTYKSVYARAVRIGALIPEPKKRVK